MFKTDLEHLRPYYPKYNDNEIQALINAANRFEEERKRFVMSIPQKAQRKQVKIAVKVNGIFVLVP